MKIQFKGKFDRPQKMDKAMAAVLSEMVDKLQIPIDTSIAIQDLQFKVAFNLNGEEKYATVPREVNGETIHEIFTVDVKLDENGNIVKFEDNEEQSLFDGYTMAQALGKEYEYNEVDTAYDETDLEEIEKIHPEGEGVYSVTYKLKTKDDVQVIRYYKGDKLVVEEEIEPKNKQK